MSSESSLESALAGAVESLKNLREELAQARNAVAGAKTTVEQTIEYARMLYLKVEADGLTDEVSAQETIVRALALREYSEHPDNKKPTRGVSIAVTRVVDGDWDSAEQWARVNFPGVLKLDRDALAKAILSEAIRCDALVVREQPVARIAREL